jgi:hypothetical protein
MVMAVDSRNRLRSEREEKKRKERKEEEGWPFQA